MMDALNEPFITRETDVFSSVCYTAFPTLLLQSFWRFIYVDVACPMLTQTITSPFILSRKHQLAK